MPLLETSSLKEPLKISTASKNTSALIELMTQDCVPGDSININLTLSHNNTSKKQPIANENVIIVELKQTLKVSFFNDVPDQISVIATERFSSATSYSANCIRLFVPSHLPPSFVGRLTRVSYAVHVRVQQRKGALGGLFKHDTQLAVIPVTIGTLGYGVLASNRLQSYTNVTESAANSHVPKFLQVVEYEEALPLYQSGSLPSYNEATMSTTT